MKAIHDAVDNVLARYERMDTEILDPAFNQLVSVMAAKINWVAVAGEPYATFDEMRDHYRRYGFIEVSQENSDGTIFGHKQTNWAFRAWHDYCHILADADFSIEGERTASALQVTQMRDFLSKGYGSCNLYRTRG